MKRTLTAAAAVLASSAGAVGFAATANAAETPQLPAELPTDNNLAQTAYHFAGTLHSAKQTVGDVVPLEQQLAGPSNRQLPLGSLSGLLGGTPLGGLLGGATGGQGLAPSNALGGLLGGATGGRSLDPSSTLGALPIGEVIPAGQTLPAPKSGGPADDLLPPGTGSALDHATAGTPETKPAQLPPAEQNPDLVGEALSGVLAGSPVGDTELPVGKAGDPLSGITGPEGPLGGLSGGLPIGKATPAAPLDKVNDLLSHGPLGGTNQLGG
ncbi:hypothetical protein MOQ72_31280 [Saccharopolyspora sp. K220]|uniref:hypothetical protein n=1 Tax=Saccharopolyspora soli TaxID=2926618 RepID=UPI001F59234A|nr:hypothetical protein [Saccharopolyspora soli]MCI2421927.1 hypothetical protein [Saccharopolyspora soli]